MIDDVVEIENDMLDELIGIAIENEYCPRVYDFTSNSDCSDDCPGFERGLSCEECWIEYLNM